MDEYYKDTGSEGKNESNNEDSEEEVTEEETSPNLVSTLDNQRCEYGRSIHRRNRCTNSNDNSPSIIN